MPKSTGNIIDVLAHPMSGENGGYIPEFAMHLVRTLRLGSNNTNTSRSIAQSLRKMIVNDNNNTVLVESEKQLARLHVLNTVWSNEARFNQLFRQFLKRKRPDLRQAIEGEVLTDRDPMIKKSLKFILKNAKDELSDDATAKRMSDLFQIHNSYIIDPVIEFRNAICHSVSRSYFLSGENDIERETSNEYAIEIFREADAISATMISDSLNAICGFAYSLMSSGDTNAWIEKYIKIQRLQQDSAPYFSHAPLRGHKDLKAALSESHTNNIRKICTKPANAWRRLIQVKAKDK